MQVASEDEIRKPCRGRVKTFAELPESEFTELINQGTPVLLLSTRDSDPKCTKIGEQLTNQFKFDHQHADSMDSYEQKVAKFLLDAETPNSSEVAIVHEIETTVNCQQPVLGGKIVTESDLYRPLYRRRDAKSTKLYVFYLQCPTECEDEVSFNKTDLSDKKSTLENSEFHSFVVGKGGANWQEVLRAFHSLDTVEDLANQISKHCCSLRSRKMTGLPKAESQSPVACELIDQPPVPKAESQSPVACELVDQPPVPEAAQQDAFNVLQSLHTKPSSECAEPNVFVSIVIGKYANSKANRVGFEKDKEYFLEIAQQLGCSTDNVHTLCPANDYVTADEIKDFLRNIAQDYKSKSVLPRCVFLAVSAHGNRAGIRDSDANEVSVEELMKDLESLGGFVLLLYQACRGSRFHPIHRQSDQFYTLPLVFSLGFENPKTLCCSLPALIPRSAAIFASMADYAAYRNEVKGGWLPRALLDVSRRSESVSVRQLAQLVQARICEMSDDGAITCRQGGSVYETSIQIQFSANGGCEDFVIETGLATGARLF
ncbi:hypothetical protein BOX15_Mlig012038g1 [Macrostomum lignano]|uniref:Caspase family p20 domain-containing protein n=1 Tax=Macrostomum lignano TaxID=282301 RepID=A0A267FK42_9PLAT|nr:hypothetical protein BOX15_Mlig012038g1 [Macrostomum lignano]